MADTVTLSDAPTADVLRAIGNFQALQRTNRPDSLTWQLASEQLAKLFAEMARRPKVDDLNAEYQRWAKAQPGDVLGRGDAVEALAHPDTTDAQKAYLRNFIARHDRAQDAR